MFVNSDFSELLSIFKRNSVKYLVIGGYAFIQYAEPRFTKDLDILIAANPKNAKVVYQSLLEFGAPLQDLTEADFAKEGYFYQMGSPPVRVDILMDIPGVNFAEAWERRLNVDFGDTAVSFISKQDLIAAKRASGRPRDLLDIELLTDDK